MAAQAERQEMANRIELALSAVAKALGLIGTRFAVVGGLAVSARSRPRVTGDVDVAVPAADDVAAEAIVHALTRQGYRVRTLIEHRSTGRMATVRFDPPDPKAQGVLVDLLFAASGIETEVVAHASACEFTGGPLPTATLGHLIAMKLLSEAPHRPDDASDLIAMLSVASPRDLSTARAAARLISARGYAPRRDLLHRLERFRKLAATASRDLRPVERSRTGKRKPGPKA